MQSLEAGLATTVVFAFGLTKAGRRRGRSKFTSLSPGLFEDLAPGTNPTRFDAGGYVDINSILHDLKTTIDNAPENYFKKPAQKKLLQAEEKVLEGLLNSKAKARAINLFLDVMKGEVNLWVVDVPTKTALTTQIDTEKTFVFVGRK